MRSEDIILRDAAEAACCRSGRIGTLAGGEHRHRGRTIGHFGHILQARATDLVARAVLEHGRRRPERRDRSLLHARAGELVHRHAGHLVRRCRFVGLVDRDAEAFLRRGQQDVAAGVGDGVGRLEGRQVRLVGVEGVALEVLHVGGGADVETHHGRLELITQTGGQVLDDARAARAGARGRAGGVTQVHSVVGQRADGAGVDARGRASCAQNHSRVVAVHSASGGGSHHQCAKCHECGRFSSEFHCDLQTRTVKPSGWF